MNKKRKFSISTKEKISKSLIGNKRAKGKRTKEFCEKMHFSHLGLKQTSESKEKIRNTLSGTKRPPEVVEKIKRALTGKVLTEERKQKNRELSPMKKLVYLLNVKTGEYSTSLSMKFTEEKLGIPRYVINANTKKVIFKKNPNFSHIFDDIFATTLLDKEYLKNVFSLQNEIIPSKISSD